MQLDPRACEYYRLQITATPEVSTDAWELSIDDGENWTAATEVNDLPAWLVAGPDYEGGQSAIEITATATPLIRLIDNPETIIRNTPTIRLTN